MIRVAPRIAAAARTITPLDHSQTAPSASRPQVGSVTDRLTIFGGGVALPTEGSGVSAMYAAEPLAWTRAYGGGAG
jgi:hypothetical protein